MNITPTPMLGARHVRLLPLAFVSARPLRPGESHTIISRTEGEQKMPEAKNASEARILYLEGAMELIVAGARQAQDLYEKRIEDLTRQVRSAREDRSAAVLRERDVTHERDEAREEARRLRAELKEAHSSKPVQKAPKRARKGATAAK